MPFNLFHVEHCVRCAAHSKSTRHVPGSYERVYADFCRRVQSILPHSVMYENVPLMIALGDAAAASASSSSSSSAIRCELCAGDDDGDNTDGMGMISANEAPRLGAFEVALKAYRMHETITFYSKLSLGSFPKMTSIDRKLRHLFAFAGTAVVGVSRHVGMTTTTGQSSGHGGGDDSDADHPHHPHHRSHGNGKGKGSASSASSAVQFSVRVQVRDSYSDTPLKDATVRLFRLSSHFIRRQRGHDAVALCAGNE